MATLAKDVALVAESDLSMKKGLSAVEVDSRLMTLAKAHRRLESTLCFYLQDVEERQLYIEFGHASTVDYARELCTYATTPPFDPDKEDDGGYVRSIAERDAWRCTRPGCRSRTALQGDHIKSRSQGGPDEDWNKTTLCAVCHHAKTTGILKVSGRAPDGLTWEGPFGVIEKPLPLPEPTNGTGRSLAREERTSYDDGVPPMDSGAMVSQDERSRGHYRRGDGTSTDHVVTEVGASRLNKKTPRVVLKTRVLPKKKPSRHIVC